MNQRFTFDLIWPIAYGLFLTIGLAYVTKSRTSAWVKRSYWLPIGAVFIDYLENIMTATVMYRYPKETIILSDLAGVMTSLKWIALSISFIALIGLSIIWIIKKFRKGSN